MMIEYSLKAFWQGHNVPANALFLYQFLKGVVLYG